MPKQPLAYKLLLRDIRCAPLSCKEDAFSQGANTAMGVSAGAALTGLLALVLIFVALIGLIYMILGILPLPPSGDSQFAPCDEPSPSTQNDISTRYTPTKFLNRLHIAFFTGVIWFFLWVMFTHVLPRSDTWRHNIVAQAFGYATVSVAALVIVVWCAVCLWRRFVRGKRTP